VLHYKKGDNSIPTLHVGIVLCYSVHYKKGDNSIPTLHVYCIVLLSALKEGR